jgi:hypothetical protein
LSWNGVSFPLRGPHCHAMNELRPRMFVQRSMWVVLPKSGSSRATRLNCGADGVIIEPSPLR